MSDISDLKFDDKNFNQHTAKGLGLLEKSLQQFGAGRSILIDKNNRIIGGNGVVEAAGNIGLEDVQIVESDGKKIIAVKRTDIDLDSKEGRELAMADNAVAAEDLSWDKGNIDEVSEQFGIDPGDWISDWIEPKQPNEVSEKQAKTILCPNCGEEIEVRNGQCEIKPKNNEYSTGGTIKTFYGEDPAVWKGEE